MREPTEADRARLRAHLDRRPLTGGRSWLDWYAWSLSGEPIGEYLDQRSARTGPDAVGAAQRCGCEQCSPEVTDV